MKKQKKTPVLPIIPMDHKNILGKKSEIFLEKLGCPMPTSTSTMTPTFRIKLSSNAKQLQKKSVPCLNVFPTYLKQSTANNVCIINISKMTNK
jgi:hypothetical protein